MKQFAIDISEVFPHLSKTPIAEAVLEIRARANDNWSAGTVSAALSAHLLDYPEQSAHKSNRPAEELGWHGVEAKSSDGKQIAFFERDRFLFSRLAPYSGWADFEAETERLWNIHQALAQPVDAQRIGLRFINRMVLPTEDAGCGEYLRAAPKAPDGMSIPFSGFLHREVFAVPNYDYGLAITRAIQPNAENKSANPTLIIDVEAYAAVPIPLEEIDFKKRLGEMRWLKNKAFFGTISEYAKEQFL